MKAIKTQVIKASEENPENENKIRDTARKLLTDLLEHIGLPGDETEASKKAVDDSKLLKSLVEAGEKTVLLMKLKEALVDLVAHKLL